MRRTWLYPALAGWSALCWVILARRGGIDWKFFSTGTSLLFGGHPPVIAGITGGPGTAGPAGLPGPPPPGGLHIFANYPALQMGPLSYLVTGAISRLGPHHGLVAAEVLLAAAGLLIVAVIDRITVHQLGIPVPGAALLAGGAVFMVAWTELAAAFAHLDDGLALLLATVAVSAIVSRHPVLAGLCVGLAADAKPWALVFLPVALIPLCLDWGPPAGERLAGGPAAGGPAAGERWLAAGQALTAAVLVTAAGYLPFLIADPGTIHATRFLIRNEPNSALRALGVTANYTPSWDRPAQILLGWLLGTLAVLRRRWPAVLLLAGAARIVLDPAAHSYYTPDVLVGALLWDLCTTRLPWWTVITFLALNITPHLTADQAVPGAVRLALVAAITLTVLGWPGKARRAGQATGSPPRQTRRGARP